MVTSRKISQYENAKVRLWTPIRNDAGIVLNKGKSFVSVFQKTGKCNKENHQVPGLPIEE
jgi:hypothetical protein